MEKMDFISIARRYFDIMPDKENEQEIVSQITKGVNFKGANLWVLIFAIFIASLGLNVNSTAVIIGAMLISPLMGPIIGMGLAIGINDLELLKRAARNFGVATLISILTATAYFLLTPLSEAQSELLARTSPTIYDVFIATCGGAAGIIALCTKGKGNVIPGVAIATALMPPLCTAGYGIATGHPLYFLGAIYLFFINTVFISFATFIGVRLMKFQRKEFISVETEKTSKRVMLSIVVLTCIPAVLMTVSIVRKSIFETNLSKFIKAELAQSGTQILSNSVDEATNTLSIVAVGKEISKSKQKEAGSRLGFYGLADYKLNVIQGEMSDSVMQEFSRKSRKDISQRDNDQKLIEFSSQVTSLKTQLEHYTRYERIGADVRGEVSILFPKVKSIALSPVVENMRDTVATKRYVSAIVHTENNRRLSVEEVERLSTWLKERVSADSLVVVPIY